MMQFVTANCWLTRSVSVGEYQMADRSNNSYIFIDISIKISHSARVQLQTYILIQFYDKPYANPYTSPLCGWCSDFKWIRLKMGNFEIIWHILCFLVLFMRFQFHSLHTHTEKKTLATQVLSLKERLNTAPSDVYCFWNDLNCDYVFSLYIKLLDFKPMKCVQLRWQFSMKSRTLLKFVFLFD